VRFCRIAQLGHKLLFCLSLTLPLVSDQWRAMARFIVRRSDEYIRSNDKNRNSKGGLSNATASIQSANQAFENLWKKCNKEGAENFSPHNGFDRRTRWRMPATSWHEEQNHALKKNG
jgi:hypothetical protein